LTYKIFGLGREKSRAALQQQSCPLNQPRLYGTNRQQDGINRNEKWNNMTKTVERRNIKNILKIALVIPACLLVVGLIFTACDSNNSIISGKGSPGQEQPVNGKFSPDVALQVSYNQKTMTFSRYWPDGVIARKAKSGAGGNERMLDYENVHEVVAYDQDGYMHMSRKYVEGNADLTMPEDLYEDVKDEMPAHASDYDPVVRSELGDGTLTYYTQSGKVAYQMNVDKEKLRIDPATLDSLKQAAGDTSGTDNKVAERLGRLQKQGISFKKLNSRDILLDSQARPDDEEDVAAYKEVIDLAINRPIRSAVVRKDGKLESLSLMHYKKVSGYPVMASSETLHYGMRNGKWSVKTRTIRNRTNINVHFNINNK